MLARADVVAHLLVEEAEVVVVHERAAGRRALDGGRRVLDLLREVLADVARRRLEERVVAPPDGQRPAAAAAHRRLVGSPWCLRPTGRGVGARVPEAGVWSCRVAAPDSAVRAVASRRTSTIKRPLSCALLDKSIRKYLRPGRYCYQDTNHADSPESALHKFGTAPWALIKAPPVDRGLLKPLQHGGHRRGGIVPTHQLDSKGEQEVPGETPHL